MCRYTAVVVTFGVMIAVPSHAGYDYEKSQCDADSRTKVLTTYAFCHVWWGPGSHAGGTAWVFVPPDLYGYWDDAAQGICGHHWTWTPEPGEPTPPEKQVGFSAGGSAESQSSAGPWVPWKGHAEAEGSFQATIPQGMGTCQATVSTVADWPTKQFDAQGPVSMSDQSSVRFTGDWDCYTSAIVSVDVHVTWNASAWCESEAETNPG